MTILSFTMWSMKGVFLGATAQSSIGSESTRCFEFQQGSAKAEQRNRV